jgi:FdrA protein
MQTKAEELLNQPLIVINVGLQQFSDNLRAQDVQVVQVDWVPPAGGDKEMLDLLDRLL